MIFKIIVKFCDFYLFFVCPHSASFLFLDTLKRFTRKFSKGRLFFKKKSCLGLPIPNANSRHRFFNGFSLIEIFLKCKKSLVWENSRINLPELFEVSKSGKKSQYKVVVFNFSEKKPSRLVKFLQLFDNKN